MIASHIALLAILAGTIPITPGVQLEGWVTTYGCPGEERFHGVPLYCDTWDTDLVYRVDQPYWGAVDVSELESGNVVCGDRVMACTGKSCALITIWDAGYLYYDRVNGEPWPRTNGRKVVLDLPYHVTRELGWTGLDPVTVTNLSRMERERTWTREIGSREPLRPSRHTMGNRR